MSEKLDKIENKVDKIQEDIGAIKVILATNTESLQIHIKRTDLLEESIKPVERHVAMVSGVLKFIGFLAVLASIIEVILKVKNG